jgi:hypothetical protein
VDEDEIKLIKEIKQKIKEWDITISYDMNIWEIKNDSWEAIKIDTSKLLTYDEKSILWKWDSMKIKNSLNAVFLMKDIKNLVLFYLKWDKVSYELSYENLENRLNKLLNIFGITSSLDKYEKYSLVKLIWFVDLLSLEMHNNYYTPIKYTDRLVVLKAWLVLLNNIKFGKYHWESFDFTQVFVKLNIQNYSKSLTIN